MSDRYEMRSCALGDADQYLKQAEREGWTFLSMSAFWDAVLECPGVVLLWERKQ